jgi:hypothetical protein
MQNRRWSTVLFLILLVSPVLFLAWSSYEPGNGFLSMIYFGERFEPRQLPEVQAIAPPANSELGYDGQYYAQLSIDPSLQHPSIPRQVPGFFWRAKRIGLPVIAFSLGLGQPLYILHVYSVINIFFWRGLLVLLNNRFDLRRVKARFMVIAILWSSGTLISIERALLDLPALVFTLLPLLVQTGWIWAALFVAYGILTKETSGLSAPAILWVHRSPYARLFRSALIIGGIPFSWYMYLLYIGAPPRETNTLSSLPLQSLWNKFYDAQLHLQTVIFIGLPHPLLLSEAIFEVLGPASLAIQSIYYFFRFKMTDKFWWFGIGFTLLLPFLGNVIWEEQAGFTRILLPLTVAFNLLVFRHEKGRAYVIWWLLGNLGMFGLLTKLIISLTSIYF